MSMYNVRIVLHEATREEYTRMADQLSRSGIVDTIVGSNSARYEMPPAEYHYNGPASIDQIFDAAKAAAAATGRRCAVMIGEISRCKWVGLDTI